MENKFFVAYYRVSTAKQGQSMLGLDAQRTSVLNFIKFNGNKLVAEFTEIESGKNNNRPELLKAIESSKINDATLVISRLDRLSRNLTFVSTLMDSKIKFVCVDMPDANELTISIFASLAQWERKRISERTKDALAAKKRREPNWKPGTNNFTDEGSAKGRATIQSNIINNQANRHAFHFIRPLREQGYTFQRIAEALNAENYKTRNGASFFASQVRAIWKRMKE